MKPAEPSIMVHDEDSSDYDPAPKPDKIKNPLASRASKNPSGRVPPPKSKMPQLPKKTMAEVPKVEADLPKEKVMNLKDLMPSPKKSPLMNLEPPVVKSKPVD